MRASHKIKSTKKPARHIPDRLNFFLVLGISAVMLAQLFLLPFLLPGHSLWALVIIVALIPLHSTLWSLIHEGVHKNLFSNKKANEYTSRLLSVLFGADFNVLRFGHLMHHQYNRDWESEIYPQEKGSRWGASLNHYFKMLGGLYLTEVITSYAIAVMPHALSQKILPYIFDNPKHVQAAQRKLLKPKNILQTRHNMVGVTVLYTSAFLAYGASFLWLVFFIAGRALIISLMDNAYHYGTAEDNSEPGKELAAPLWMQAVLLNFNHHETHHLYAYLPWTMLREKHHERRALYSQGLGDALAEQFKGPIFPQPFVEREKFTPYYNAFAFAGSYK